MKQNKYEEFQLLRGLAIIFVVLGHSVIDGTQQYNILDFIIKLIYSFHMPLYFFISGFFAIKIFDIYNNKKLSKGFIGLKFKRLMIPYFSVTVLSIPIKLIMSSFVKRPLLLNEVLFNTLFYPQDNPVSSLWFIYCLFIINIFMIFILYFIKKRYIFIIILTLFISTMFYKIQILNLYSVFRNIIFFYIGLLVRENYIKVRHIINLNINKLLIIALIGLFILNKINTDNLVLIQIIYVMTGLLGTLASFIIILKIKRGSLSKLLEKLGYYSYDIYLLSWFSQNCIGYMLLKVFNLNYSWVIVLTFISGFLPIIICKYFIGTNHLLSSLILGAPTKVNKI